MNRSNCVPIPIFNNEKDSKVTINELISPATDERVIEVGRNAENGMDSICLSEGAVWVLRGKCRIEIHNLVDAEGKQTHLGDEEILQVSRDLFAHRESLTLEVLNEALPGNVQIKQI